MPTEKHKISSAIKGATCVDEDPRNIHSVRNEGRRRARGEASLWEIEGWIRSSTTLRRCSQILEQGYVCHHSRAWQGMTVNVAMVVIGFSDEGNELVIVVTLQGRRDVTIFSDL
ncbi:hypothetical protein MTO96_034321 [Rhipicephalus appendiculatus]